MFNDTSLLQPVLSASLSQFIQQIVDVLGQGNDHRQGDAIVWQMCFSIRQHSDFPHRLFRIADHMYSPTFGRTSSARRNQEGLSTGTIRRQMARRNGRIKAFRRISGRSSTKARMKCQSIRRWHSRHQPLVSPQEKAPTGDTKSCSRTQTIARGKGRSDSWAGRGRELG